MSSSQGNSSWTQVNTPSTFEADVWEVIKKHASMHGNQMLVKVKKVHGGVSLIGHVDVQPMVHQQDALGRTKERTIIKNVPYLRIQGGASALIIDPKEDDIGFVVVSSRDHQNVLKSRKPAAPGSFRMHDLSDCVYLGAFIADTPKRYIYATDKGWRIHAEETIELEAKKVTVNCDIETEGNITAKGDIKSNSDKQAISLTNHTHGGVMSGGGNTGKPQ